jgi:hypothetical protein
VVIAQNTRNPKIVRNIHINPFAAIRETSNDIHINCQQKERREIPRRRKPVVQQQGHRVPMLQAEHRELGRQKLDNQEWRRCLHNSG